MPAYQCHGLSIHTNERLEELDPGREAASPLRVDFTGAPWPATTTLRSMWDGDGEALHGSVQGDAWVLAFPADIHFTGAFARDEITCHRGETPWAKARAHHLLLNHVLPLVLAARGEIVLHGAALARGERAIGVLGPSGAGKSTLALHLARRGAALLSDDGFRVTSQGDVCTAWPSYPAVRLWRPDAEAEELVAPGGDAHEKSCVRAGAAGLTATSDPHPLAGLFVLDEARDPADGPERLTGPTCFATLVRNTFHWGELMPGLMPGLLEGLLVLAAGVPVYRVGRRSAPGGAEAVTTMIWDTWTHV